MFSIPSHVGFAIDDYSGKMDSKEKLLKNIFTIYDICCNIGINEITFYGISNFYNEIVCQFVLKGAKLIVVGNTESAYFPNELLQFVQNRTKGDGIKVNLLINYSMIWDTDNKISSYYYRNNYNDERMEFISNIDLIIVWNGKKEIKKFLPLQTAKSDICIEKELFMNFEPIHIYNAIRHKCYKNVRYEVKKA